jgi:hypothetical protein
MGELYDGVLRGADHDMIVDGVPFNNPILVVNRWVEVFASNMVHGYPGVVTLMFGEWKGLESGAAEILTRTPSGDFVLIRVWIPPDTPIWEFRMGTFLPSVNSHGGHALQLGFNVSIVFDGNQVDAVNNVKLNPGAPTLTAIGVTACGQLSE